jgi:hypothetical protein
MTLIAKRPTLLFAALLMGSVVAARADDTANIQLLADGKAWNAQPSGGPKMKMTFNPDGTGQMKFGIMTRKINWKANAGGICMSGLPGGGSNCMVLTATANGFTGQSADGKSLVLSR